MKLKEITEEGFYWARADEHRAWAIVFLARSATNPSHPRHNEFLIAAEARPYRSNAVASPGGEFIGPITPPPQ